MPKLEENRSATLSESPSATRFTVSSRAGAGEDERVFCGACGARIDAASRFCTSCGAAQAQYAERGEEGEEAPARDEPSLAAPPRMEPQPGGDTLAGARTEILPPPEPPPAPAMATATAVRAPGKESQATGIVIVGYVCAVLLPIVGVVIGATQHERNRHGIRIVSISLVMLALGFVTMMLVLGSASSSVQGPGY